MYTNVGTQIYPIVRCCPRLHQICQLRNLVLAITWISLRKRSQNNVYNTVGNSQCNKFIWGSFCWSQQNRLHMKPRNSHMRPNLKLLKCVEFRKRFPKINYFTSSPTDLTLRNADLSWYSCYEANLYNTTAPATYDTVHHEKAISLTRTFSVSSVIHRHPYRHPLRRCPMTPPRCRHGYASAASSAPAVVKIRKN